MKRERQEKILELISTSVINTQEDLLQKLTESGYVVTQATVSRDIRELRLVKKQGSDREYRYMVEALPQPEDPERYRDILNRSVVKIDSAFNQVVIKCYSGMAGAACAALDGLSFDVVVGTLSGDDTILAITRTEEAARAFVNKLGMMIQIPN